MIVRPQGPHKHYEAVKAEDLPKENPLKGKKIHIHSTSFKIGVDEIVGALDGPPAYIMRLKRIEDWMDRVLRKIGLVWMETALRYAGAPHDFERDWKTFIENYDFGMVNKWINDHNLYYPIEANLPYDIKTGKVMHGNEPFRKKSFIGPRWLIEAYPPDHGMALREAERNGVEISDQTG